MKPPDDAKAHIIAAATLGAITEAWRQGGDLLATRPPGAAPAVLLEQAARMAESPLGRDQVLSLALFAAAEDLGAGGSQGAASEFLLAEPEPDDARRLCVRMRVLNSASVPAADARRVAQELERRYRPECSNDLQLADRLVVEANLHERLWDDPRLPGDDRARLTMLFTIPQLLERADALHRRGEPRRERPPSSTAQRLVGRLIWARVSGSTGKGVGGQA